MQEEDCCVSECSEEAQGLSAEHRGTGPAWEEGQFSNKENLKPAQHLPFLSLSFSLSLSHTHTHTHTHTRSLTHCRKRGLVLKVTD
jgi:hypothetical protein